MPSTSSIDLSQFTDEQRSEIEKMLRTARPQPKASVREISHSTKEISQFSKVNKKSLKPNVFVDAVATKKRIRSKRMSKVNGLTMLTHITTDNKNIRLQCLEDPQESVLLPIDWALAKKAGKALANFVKAKHDLASFKTLE